jgi:cytochrome P450
MRARTRDRAVYLAAHPFLFALLAATRHRPTFRLGRNLLVHDPDAYVAALTRLPLDRTAEGTTGGAVTALGSGSALFDQQGRSHRATRRTSADPLSAAGVAALRPTWTNLMSRSLAPLAGGARIDLVPLAAQVAGATALAVSSASHPAIRLTPGPADLLADRARSGAPAERADDAWILAEAARAAAAATAREHLPGLFRGRARDKAKETAERLTALVAPDGGDHAGLHAMLAVAAINTTVAALPRAAAWAADDDLWNAALEELLRVIAPAPLLPRAAARDGELPPGCPVRAGDRLMLMARHAAGAHRSGPDPAAPAPPHVARLIFGVGPHACPGARLARAQMADWLAALAPYRPVVTRARPDRRSALPGWRSLVIRAGEP